MKPSLETLEVLELTEYILEHCESIGENQMNLQTGSIGDLNLPELSNSFRNKLAQWDDLGIVQRSNVDLRQRKKRGSSSASAVLQRMSLPGKKLEKQLWFLKKFVRQNNKIS